MGAFGNSEARPAACSASSASWIGCTDNPCHKETFMRRHPKRPVGVPDTDELFEYLPCSLKKIAPVECVTELGELDLGGVGLVLESPGAPAPLILFLKNIDEFKDL